MIAPHELTALFESYCDALSNKDARGISGHYHYPTHLLIQDETPRTFAVATLEEMNVELQRSLAHYDEIGFAAARIISSKARDLSPQVFRVDVVWALLNVHQEILLKFDVNYTVAWIGDKWGITSAVSPNEVPRRQALLMP